MPNMMVTPKMCDTMREVLDDRTLTKDERDLLVRQIDDSTPLHFVDDSIPLGELRSDCKVIPDASR